MEMFTRRLAFVEMFLALQVHQVQFVDQSVSLQQTKRAVNRDSIDGGILALRFAQDLTGVEMAVGRLHDVQDGAALARDADAAAGEFRNQVSRSFSVRQRHRRNARCS